MPFEQGQQNIKLMVPDSGLDYLHNQKALVKVLEEPVNYLSLEAECAETIKVGNSNKQMTPISTVQYNMLSSITYQGT